MKIQKGNVLLPFEKFMKAFDFRPDGFHIPIGYVDKSTLDCLNMTLYVRSSII